MRYFGQECAPLLLRSRVRAELRETRIDFRGSETIAIDAETDEHGGGVDTNEFEQRMRLAAAARLPLKAQGGGHGRRKRAERDRKELEHGDSGMGAVTRVTLPPRNRRHRCVVATRPL